MQTHIFATKFLFCLYSCAFLAAEKEDKKQRNVTAVHISFTLQIAIIIKQST